jgi:hypothetical protein
MRFRWLLRPSEISLAAAAFAATKQRAKSVAAQAQPEDRHRAEDHRHHARNVVEEAARAPPRSRRSNAKDDADQQRQGA